MQLINRILILIYTKYKTKKDANTERMGQCFISPGYRTKAQVLDANFGCHRRCGGLFRGHTVVTKRGLDLVESPGKSDPFGILLYLLFN